MKDITFNKKNYFFFKQGDIHQLNVSRQRKSCWRWNYINKHPTQNLTTVQKRRNKKFGKSGINKMSRKFQLLLSCTTSFWDLSLFRWKNYFSSTIVESVVHCWKRVDVFSRKFCHLTTHNIAIAFSVSEVLEVSFLKEFPFIVF